MNSERNLSLEVSDRFLVALQVCRNMKPVAPRRRHRLCHVQPSGASISRCRGSTGRRRRRSSGVRPRCVRRRLYERASPLRPYEILLVASRVAGAVLPNARSCVSETAMRVHARPEETKGIRRRVRGNSARRARRLGHMTTGCYAVVARLSRASQKSLVSKCTVRGCASCEHAPN